MKLPFHYILILATILLTQGCKAQPEQDLLLGEWKVFHIKRGGEEIGGPRFKGSTFHFRPDGIVYATAPSGDTTSTPYIRNGDTLIYTAPEIDERYHIDTLDNAQLVISAELQVIPTTVSMTRIQKTNPPTKQSN